MIEIRRDKRLSAGVPDLINTDRSKNEMDIIRSLMKRIDDAETVVRDERLTEMDGAPLSPRRRYAS